MANQLAQADKKYITETVMANITQKHMNGDIQFPADYSPQNSIYSAYLKLQGVTDKTGKPALEVCTRESIANSILDMVIQGLNPSKNQCYFIVYGKTLQLQRSYLGTIAITKRIKGVKDVKGFALYKNDEFELGFDFMTGAYTIEKYKPASQHKEADLIGAFAMIIGEKSILHVEKMDMDQVRKAWNQGTMKGSSGAHKNFPDQMAIKTVINRACKTYASTADDSGYVTDLINKTDRYVEDEIELNANTEMLDDDIPEAEIIDEETGEILEDDPVNTIDEKPPF